MEIVNVNSRTWEMMIAKFDAFAARVDALCKKNEDRCLQKWLTNEDVCGIINVSKRTLQTYRDSSKLSYSQIGHKIYYRPEDVERLVEKLGRG